MSIKCELYNDDCLNILPSIEDKSVQLVLCDLPYGTTPLSWDKCLPTDKLWEQYKRVIKDDGCIVLFGQEPFSSLVRTSNLSMYKYDWIWEKERLTNVFQVKRRPGKTVENIMVFYNGQCKYYPQKTEHLGPPIKNKVGKKARFSATQVGDRAIKPLNYNDDGTRYPTQVLRFNKDNIYKRIHPTQKPVSLLEYLIHTYTDTGDTVLDNCMGSGSTGIACINTDRNFIGIESDSKYFSLAESWIEQHRKEKEENDKLNSQTLFPY